MAGKPRIYLTPEQIARIKQKNRDEAVDENTEYMCEIAAKAIRYTMMGDFDLLEFDENTEELEDALRELNVVIQAYRRELH